MILQQICVFLEVLTKLTYLQPAFPGWSL